ncbi:MAG: TetR/AcrR family transcriptional regulator [Ilumatobacteraceae bacterium]
MDRPIAVPMRATLLHAALTVLRRDGAAALTVRNITAEAGCSTTGVYTYFGGKHGLVEAIYLEGFESFDEALDYDGELIEAGRAYRRWALANPTHYLVMFGRAVPEFVPGEQAAQRAASSFALLVEAVGRAGATDPLSSAYHVYATVHGYVMLELIGRGPVETEALDHLYETGLQSVLRAWR